MNSGDQSGGRRAVLPGWLRSHLGEFVVGLLVAVIGGIILYFVLPRPGPGDDDDDDDLAAATSTPTTSVSETDASRLAALRIGTTLANLESSVGEPVTRTPIPDSGGWVRTVHVGANWYVTAISDESQTVQAFWVTSCDQEFQPVIGGGELGVTLWAAMANVFGDSTELHYNHPGNGQEPVWSEVIPPAGITGFEAQGVTATSYCPVAHRPDIDRATIESLPWSSFVLDRDALSPSQLQALNAARARMQVNSRGVASLSGLEYFVEWQVRIDDDARAAGVW
jgi:hypothetical protein